MSHPEQLEFMRLARTNLTNSIKHGRILEIGSYDVNGSIRDIFNDGKEYIGVDLTPGPGVDIVSFGHKLDLADGYFDLSISAECFEHDPNWKETFENMVRLTRPGGVVLFTCASSGRPEHGTTRSDPTLSPGTQTLGLDYYKNLNQADFETSIQLKDMFQIYKFWYLKNHGDLYFMGWRTTHSTDSEPINVPNDTEVLSISKLMSLPHRLIRIPLRITSNLLPESKFQSFASSYWKNMTRLQEKFFGGRFSR